MQIWPVSLKNRLKMYTFLRATKNRFKSVQTDSVACGFKRFFISEKPELQLTVRFFCGSVRFSCSFFPVVWTRPSNTTYSHKRLRHDCVSQGGFQHRFTTLPLQILILYLTLICTANKMYFHVSLLISANVASSWVKRWYAPISPFLDSGLFPAFWLPPAGLSHFLSLH